MLHTTKLADSLPVVCMYDHTHLFSEHNGQLVFMHFFRLTDDALFMLLFLLIGLFCSFLFIYLLFNCLCEHKCMYVNSCGGRLDITVYGIGLRLIVGVKSSESTL